MYNKYIPGVSKVNEYPFSNSLSPGGTPVLTLNPSLDSPKNISPFGYASYQSIVLN